MSAVIPRSEVNLGLEHRRGSRGRTSQNQSEPARSTQNQPEPARISQNQPEPTRTSQNRILKVLLKTLKTSILNDAPRHFGTERDQLV